ncbi:heme-dependent peroxidase, partial [Planococcus sp. SIMBA_143]
MNQAAVTLDGWYCLHDFRTMNWTAWKQLSSEERDLAMNEFLTFLEKWEVTAGHKQGSHTL